MTTGSSSWRVLGVSMRWMWPGFGEPGRSPSSNSVFGGRDFGREGGERGKLKIAKIIHFLSLKRLNQLI